KYGYPARTVFHQHQVARIDASIDEQIFLELPMASTRRFMTGGGYPYPWSPGRPIEFTLSDGKSDRFDPESTHPQYNNRLDFSDPEAPAYVCAMLEPPRDEVGLTNFGRELGQAYQDVAADPAYAALPVPPLSFQDLRQAQASANSDIRSGSIAASCQWARRFAPGAKLSIDSASGADAVPYRAQARWRGFLQQRPQVDANRSFQRSCLEQPLFCTRRKSPPANPGKPAAAIWSAANLWSARSIGRNWRRREQLACPLDAAPSMMMISERAQRPEIRYLTCRHLMCRR